MDAQNVRRWPEHAGAGPDLSQLFECFLDAVYPDGGRSGLVQSVADELRHRGVEQILDCSAGTGFPALELTVTDPLLQINCTDASIRMLTVLVERAESLGVDPSALAPPRRSTRSDRWLPGAMDAAERLLLKWADLDRLASRYDYVLCRGNSLSYASSWEHGLPAVSLEVIRNDLNKVAGRVRPGGYLHIDAPWSLDDTSSTYEPVLVDDAAVQISEAVTAGLDHRLWTVSFDHVEKARAHTFQLYSKPITIYDVQAILDEFGFVETEPFSLQHERPSFGVIIARKPLDWPIFG